MKKISVSIIAAIIACSCCNSQKEQECQVTKGTVIETQEGKTEYLIEGSIPVSKTADMEWITRFAEQINGLEEKAAADTVSDIDVMFFGSSSIRLWKGLEEMMSPLKVVNRGYGGATVRDIHYNYKSVMAHYQPKAFVIFCDNDIAGNADDLTVGEVFDHYRMLFMRLEQDYPGIPVYFLSWKYSELRAGLRNKQKLVNGIMKDFADKSEQVTFVDVNALLLNEDGSVNASLFESDNLHINHDGYLLWTSLLKPQLIETCNL